ncbi:unnamed protein product [marine sediment metagenome]|uniref:NAD(P)-binding domain-containing protein n=1 Tax=marine sediment metagenome TaxID=412755 RepID=X1Q6V3_9ZZZZ
MERFDQVKNDVFNIASGKAISLVEVARTIQKYMSSRNAVLIREARTGEVETFMAGVSKAKTSLGYEPRTPINEGIRKAIE